MSWYCLSVRLPANLKTMSYVTNSTVTAVHNYLANRSLDTNRFANLRDTHETAVYTHLTSHYLQAVWVEVFGPEADDIAIEWFDAAFERTSSDDRDSAKKRRHVADFEQYHKELAAEFQTLDSLSSTADYRILLGTVNENDLGRSPPSIDGWVETTPRTAPSTMATWDIDAARQCDLTRYEHIL